MRGHGHDPRRLPRAPARDPVRNAGTEDSQAARRQPLPRVADGAPGGAWTAPSPARPPRRTPPARPPGRSASPWRGWAPPRPTRWPTSTSPRRTGADADDGDHEAVADAEATIVDEVTYKGLTPGEEYAVTGTLMDKETGEPVQLGGKDVTATASFVPDKSSGSVSLSFTFDGSALKGHDIVAFKTVSKEGAEVAVHADIDDAGQTVSLADKPATPTSPAPKGGLPKTGDPAPWIPLACLVAAAACGIAILALMRRKGHWDAEDDDDTE